MKKLRVRITNLGPQPIPLPTMRIPNCHSGPQEHKFSEDEWLMVGSDLERMFRANRIQIEFWERGAWVTFGGYSEPDEAEEAHVKGPAQKREDEPVSEEVSLPMIEVGEQTADNPPSDPESESTEVPTVDPEADLSEDSAETDPRKNRKQRKKTAKQASEPAPAGESEEETTESNDTEAEENNNDSDAVDGDSQE